MRPRWYRQVEEIFNRISEMPLVLEPNTIYSAYEQAQFGAEATVMEPNDNSAEAVMQEAAERTALAIAILSYGADFVADGLPSRLRVKRGRVEELVREAFHSIPHDNKYDQLLTEAREVDRLLSAESEADTSEARLREAVADGQIDVLMWDWKEPIPVQELTEAVRSGFLHMYTVDDTGGDFYALLVSRMPIDADEIQVAFEIWSELTGEA